MHEIGCHSTTLVCVLVIASALGAPFQNARLPVQKRALDLLGRMTLTEKLREIGLPSDSLPRAFVSLYDMKNASLSNSIQREWLLSNASRLGIPVAFNHESLHYGCPAGVVMPMGVSMGYTWNSDLVEEVFQVIARDARACGVTVGWTPSPNMYRDPRFGLHPEGFASDPALASSFVAAATAGAQGTVGPAGADRYLGNFNTSIVSLAKHFGGYADAAGGQNAGNVQASPRELLELWYRPWRAFAHSGGAALMLNHPAIDGVPAHSSAWHCNDSLRVELGFGDGMAISDGGDVHNLVLFRVARNATQAIGRTMRANCVDVNHRVFTTSSLLGALQEGQIDEQDVDRSVLRALKLKIRAGLLDQPYTPEDLAVSLNDDRSRNVARQAAAEGIVVLKNRGGALPLDAESLAHQGAIVSTIGPFADCGPSPWIMDPVPEGFKDGSSSCAARYAMLGNPSYQSGPLHMLMPTATSALRIKLRTRSTANASVALGCRASASFELSVGHFVDATPDKCLGLCMAAGKAGQYRYAGASNGSECLCSEHMPPAEGLGDCATACFGDSTQRCGGVGWADAFDVSGIQAAVVQHVPGVHPPDPLWMDGAVCRSWHGGSPRCPNAWNDSMIPAAQAAARLSRVSIIFIGDLGAYTASCSEGGDVQDLDPPGLQLQLLEAVAQAAHMRDSEGAGENSTLVLVIVGGRPMTFGASNRNEVLDAFDAVVYAGRPGSLGGYALADILVGSMDASGRLSSQWPRSVGMVGSGGANAGMLVSADFVDPSAPIYRKSRPYWPTSGPKQMLSSPLFPLGHGLSYTNFAVIGFHANVVPPESGGPPEVSFEAVVRNHGQRTGRFVMQVYVIDPMDGSIPVARPFSHLVAFNKSGPVAPGAEVKVNATAWFHDLAFHDERLRYYGLWPGRYIAQLRSSSNEYPAESYSRGFTDGVDGSGLLANATFVLGDEHRYGVTRVPGRGPW